MQIVLTPEELDALADKHGIEPDLMNRLGYQWRGHEQSLRSFSQWYREVIEPIGLDPESAWKVYIGSMSTVEWVSRLTPQEVGRFNANFPGLQAEHLTRIESGEVG